MKTATWTVAVALVALCATTTFAGLDPQTTCHFQKVDTSSKHLKCRLKVESKAIKRGTDRDFERCDLKYARKWQRVEDIGLGQCLTSGDELTVRTELEEDTEVLRTLLETGALPACGNDTREGREACDGTDVGSATCASFGFTSGTIACEPSCLRHDVTGCSGRSVFPATGQTTTYVADRQGAEEQPVDDDGSVRAGGTLDFVDNGDGTVTDLNTGLMWEKKADDGGLHDWDLVYPWSRSTEATVWEWLDSINSEGGTGFAGYSDWRLPNRRELDSLVDFERAQPAIRPVFHTNCGVGCSVTTCACTIDKDYWSSTTSKINTNLAWTVDFQRGKGDDKLKSGRHRVRAVRGP